MREVGIIDGDLAKNVFRLRGVPEIVLSGAEFSEAADVGRLVWGFKNWILSDYLDREIVTFLGSGLVLDS